MQFDEGRLRGILELQFAEAPSLWAVISLMSPIVERLSILIVQSTLYTIADIKQPVNSGFLHVPAQLCFSIESRIMA